MSEGDNLKKIEIKKCSKCKKPLNHLKFGKDRNTKDGLTSSCKTCQKLFRDSNKDKYRAYYLLTKEKRLKQMKTYGKIYRANNKEKIAEGNKKWRDNNIEAALLTSQKYYLKNKARINSRHKSYNKIESIKAKEYNANYCKSSAKYKTFKDKLTIDESSRLSEDNIHLEVKCKYCNKYFVPTIISVKGRIASLNDTQAGSQFLYCSEGCKKACPTYYQKKYSRGFKKRTSREVQPELRKLVLERDDWKCQKCGIGIDKTELHCHHLTGVEINPIESADIDNCVTLCKRCHKEAHLLPGCGYNDYRRKKCKED